MPTISGIPWSFNVALVIIPKVPSDPTIKLVRLYPAEVFLKDMAIGKMNFIIFDLIYHVILNWINSDINKTDLQDTVIKW